MTRKDYPAIAAVLARLRASYGTNWDPNLFRACTDHANAFADMLGAENPRFERARFLKDAGAPQNRSHQDWCPCIECSALRMAKAARK